MNKTKNKIKHRIKYRTKKYKGGGKLRNLAVKGVFIAGLGYISIKALTSFYLYKINNEIHHLKLLVSDYMLHKNKNDKEKDKYYKQIMHFIANSPSKLFENINNTIEILKYCMQNFNHIDHFKITKTNFDDIIEVLNEIQQDNTNNDNLKTIAKTTIENSKKETGKILKNAIDVI